jgi:hypothetical protein
MDKKPDQRNAEEIDDPGKNTPMELMLHLPHSSGEYQSMHNQHSKSHD